MTEKEPGIDFTDPLFRRRLSMVSRMTIRVLHDLMPLPRNTKIYFVSFRGELSRQLKINKTLIVEGDIKPADFSLSVFNAPPALASMAFGLSTGYSAVYPGENNFRFALLGAAACLHSPRPPFPAESSENGAAASGAVCDAAFTTASDVVSTATPGAAEGAPLALVYADEEIPGEYLALMQDPPPALALAILLCSRSAQSGVPLPGIPLPADCNSPEELLQALGAGMVPETNGNTGVPG
ncbi:MAG: beta-ketoacyl synthase chain length factor [Spirochaetaceae bacterium]|nr:beta-ketoacyl synthase chain length factor [Spirochaetaceae bacterium]